MKKLLVLFIFTTAIVMVCAFGYRNQVQTFRQVQNDSLAAERQRYIDQVLKTVKGKEDMPADSVFRNLKTFTGSAGVKVTHLLAIMKYWGTALGVSCTHCHNVANWPSDEKQTKSIAREMFAMRQTINGQILKNIQGLQSQTPRVNCGTCHRGNTIPKE